MPNYSLYSIPAYYTIAMIPHLWSIALVATNKQQWNNAAPRGKKFDESLRKGLPPPIHAQFERCRAAHSNMLAENSAFFIGAVTAGNMAGLDGAYMNSMTAWYLVTRVAYLICYIGIARQKYSYSRTVAFNAGLLILYWVYFKAAGVMAAKVGV